MMVVVITIKNEVITIMLVYVSQCNCSTEEKICSMTIWGQKCCKYIKNVYFWDISMTMWGKTVTDMNMCMESLNRVRKH